MLPRWIKTFPSLCKLYHFCFLLFPSALQKSFTRDGMRYRLSELKVVSCFFFQSHQVQNITFQMISWEYRLVSITDRWLRFCFPHTSARFLFYLFSFATVSVFSLRCCCLASLLTPQDLPKSIISSSSSAPFRPSFSTILLSFLKSQALHIALIPHVWPLFQSAINRSIIIQDLGRKAADTDYVPEWPVALSKPRRPWPILPIFFACLHTYLSY